MCQFGFFLILILFFKAREQIEKENENKSEDQQLDSSKQAMDEEDEDLLATIANKILESWFWNCMVCLIVNWKVFSRLCLIETDFLVVLIWKYWFYQFLLFCIFKLLFFYLIVMIFI